MERQESKWKMAWKEREGQIAKGKEDEIAEEEVSLGKENKTRRRPAGHPQGVINGN
jgi:hypothetical protein